MEEKINNHELNGKGALVKFVRREVTKMMEQSLDFAHVACPVEHFKQLRSKILKAGNNCMRNIEKDLYKYDVRCGNVNEEIIEFNTKN